MQTEVPRWIHRYCVALAVGILGLISAGALVKSLEAGLSVPDWPLSYGGLNPPRWWQIENVRAEHGHRLIAGAVAMATVVLACALSWREPRPWVRRLGWVAVVAVLAQALLGGITVLFFLPTAISSSHAGLAQLFFCTVVGLAVVTSRFWLDGARPGEAGAGIPKVAKAATFTTGLIFVQILVGAVMRHSGAGLAIPDFPLAFGRLIPPQFDFAIGIHYSHRVGALLVAGAVLTTVVRTFRSGSSSWALRLPAASLVVLLIAQITLGALVVLTGKQVLPNTVHVATGGALFATCLILTLTSRRVAYRMRTTPRAATSRPRLEQTAA